jgi:hypothetical protein
VSCARAAPFSIFCRAHATERPWNRPARDNDNPFLQDPRLMCGICGFVALDPSAGGRLSKDMLLAMSSRIVRRGPDGAGDFYNGVVGLAMRRLAIIDTGRRPAAHFQRDGYGRHRLQRRDLQLPGTAAAADRAGTPVQDRQRHGGHRPPLRAIRAGGSQAKPDRYGSATYPWKSPPLPGLTHC